MSSAARGAPGVEWSFINQALFKPTDGRRWACACLKKTTSPAFRAGLEK
jgi:hypothetical protein